MSSLPPYSTFRTDAKQMMYPQQLSHGNVLTFTPPGFNQTLNVKFPDCRLAVCEKCKKNYKTRDMCRVRNSHTSEPWTTAFICFTLDDNCTDENGKYVDKPFAVRMIQWQPYCAKTSFDPKTPVCSACKKTNRTRSFCRDRHKHRQLPWCTVYVLLSPADTIDPATCVAPESTPVGDDAEGEDKQVDAAKSEEPAGDTAAADPDNDLDSKEVKEEKKEIKVSDDGEDINDIAESRTFLAKVSCHASSVHWLELSDIDVAEQHASMQGVPTPDGGHMAVMGRHPGMLPGPHADYAPHFGHPAMGYAAQQHQMNLKNQQQYFFQMQQHQQQQYAAHQAQWQAQYKHSGMPPGPPPPGAITAGEAAAQHTKKKQPVPPQDQVPVPQYGQWPLQPGQMMYQQQMYQHQMAQFQQAGGPEVEAASIPQLPEQIFPDTQQQGDDLDPPSEQILPEGDEENDAKRTRIV